MPEIVFNSKSNNQVEWFAQCCGVAVQPWFGSKVQSYSDEQTITANIEKLEESVKKLRYGALVVTIAEPTGSNQQKLFNALKARKWRRVFRFKNPSHTSESVQYPVSMWYKQFSPTLREPKVPKAAPAQTAEPTTT